MSRQAILSGRLFLILLSAAFVFLLSCGSADNTFVNPLATAGDRPGSGSGTGGSNDDPAGALYTSWTVYSVKYKDPRNDQPLQSFTGDDVSGRLTFLDEYHIRVQVKKLDFDLKSDGTWGLEGGKIKLEDQDGKTYYCSYNISGEILEMTWGASEEYKFFARK